MRALPWNGHLQISGEIAWWSGAVGDAAMHRHFAAQAVFSDDPVQVIDDGGREISGTCVLIEPNARHLLRPGGRARICYVEPTTAFGPPDILREQLHKKHIRIVSGTGARSFWKDWTERRARPAIDTRISRAIVLIEQLLPDGTIRLADICAESPLSVGRFRHLFAAEIGLPFQRFVLWRRLAAAFESLLGGATVTEAAHAAGFADAAHLARTIKTMFGIRASDILPRR